MSWTIGGYFKYLSPLVLLESESLVTADFMKKIAVRSLLIILVLFVGLFWFVFFSARPPLTIDIAKGNTPGCGYDHFPLPILAACTEPLVEAADDIRGLWIGVEGGHVGHVERVEQCGARTVVTSSGIIHDYGPNSTAHSNTDDTEGAVFFTLGDREYCPRTSASMIWEDKVLNFRAFGWGPIVVNRYLQGEQLVWEYADGSTTRMDRLCQLPDEQKVPVPRGPRYSL